MVEKRKTWVGFNYGNKRKKCMWFYFMVQGYQHWFCHVCSHTNVALCHVD